MLYYLRHIAPHRTVTFSIALRTLPKPAIEMAQNNAAVETVCELTKLSEAYKQGQDGAREGLIGAPSKLLSQLLLPEESMLLLQWAQRTHQAMLCQGLDIHLFEALAADDGCPKTSRAIAEKTHPRAETLFVSHMLRHLAAMGTLSETEIDTFAPTPSRGVWWTNASATPSTSSRTTRSRCCSRRPHTSRRRTTRRPSPASTACGSTRTTAGA